MQDIPLQIIQKAADGDIDAFERIYRASSGFVYTLALRLVNNPEDAAEITQDVFMKVHNKLKDFRNESSLKTWIYRITINTGLNARKRRASYRGREVVYDENIHVQAALPAQSEMINDDNSRLLETLLGQLTFDHRTVLLLREMEGLSYRQIAGVLRINVNTVRTRIKRARQALLSLTESEVIRNEM